MPPVQNYQRALTRTLQKLREEFEKTGKRPRLLLHACCAPCASYVLEYLAPYFDITVWFYNPNIAPEEEYRFREQELRRLAREMPLPHPVTVVSAPYEPQRFEAAAQGLESAPEGGARCARCFSLRLGEAVRYAAAGGYDYVTTTLSISPLKNATLLNTIGEEAVNAAGCDGLSWLYADFKKNEGYKRSCALSKQYDLYRQNYCGCVYSRDAAKEKSE